MKTEAPSRIIVEPVGAPFSAEERKTGAHDFLLGISIAVVVLAVWVVSDTYPNYDSYYHLVWGREVVRGTLPSFDAYAAPTSHPLFLALTALLAKLAGSQADRALVLVCLTAHGIAIWGVYRLALAIFNRRTAVIATLFFAFSASFWLYSLRAYVDSLYIAVVVIAALCAVSRSQLWRPSLALVLAGLLRPETWVLTGLFALWKGIQASRRQRIFLVGLVIFAPASWLMFDWILTGNPLHSFTSTGELAEQLGRERGISAVPATYVGSLAATIRLPVLALAVVGFVFVSRLQKWRQVAVPLGLLAAGTLTFTATGLVGLPLLPRYLTIPAIACCLFAAYGCDAIAERVSKAQVATKVASWGLALVVLVATATTISTTGVRAEVNFISSSHKSLIDILKRPQVSSGLACGALTFPTYRLVPDARWQLDLPRDRVGARSAQMRRRWGVAIYALTPIGLRRYGFAAGTSPRVNLPDGRFKRVAVNKFFSAYVNCPRRR